MFVVSNTTPIISFLKIDRLELLENIFGQIIIPQAVYDELIADHSLPDEIEKITKCPFLRIEQVKNEFAVKLLQKQLNLGLGESESILLADTLKASLLIIDERKGRNIAKDMGLQITGTLGILVEAKNQKYIDRIEPLLNKLIEKDIRISKKLYDEIMTLAGEK
jgi:predicted nucleic acid-binding protein